MQLLILSFQQTEQVLIRKVVTPGCAVTLLRALSPFMGGINLVASPGKSEWL